jgi:sugar/nucleoside kinase (ribokinase family)
MQAVLFGVVCLDHYTTLGLMRPGCGILHNAYHLRQLGHDPLLITRIGDADGQPVVDFVRRNRIRTLAELAAPGTTAAIDITLRNDGEAHIANFRAGVWNTFRLTPAEEEELAGARHLHLVMVGRTVDEFLRLRQAGRLAKTFVSADFLARQDFPVDRLVALLALVDLAFIGWPGRADDPQLAAIGQGAIDAKMLLIVTLGAQGALLYDGTTTGLAHPQFFPVTPEPVQGSTNGCGDAFISYFLAEYWRSHNLAQAMVAGQDGGALATQWRLALPDAAYGEE